MKESILGFISMLLSDVAEDPTRLKRANEVAERDLHLFMDGEDNQKEMVEVALEADREASLRDVFATAALGAIIARDGSVTMEQYQKAQVRLAYAYADVMLTIRKGNS